MGKTWQLIKNNDFITYIRELSIVIVGVTVGFLIGSMNDTLVVSCNVSLKLEHCVIKPVSRADRYQRDSDAEFAR